MARFGLCGPTYNSQSPTADGERAVNFYPEVIESLGKSQIVLYPTPGTKKFAQNLDGPPRGEYTFQARTFAVAGTKFYELLANGTAQAYGEVIDDGLPVAFAANQNAAPQLIFNSGGTLYLFNLATLAISRPVGLLGQVAQVGFCDGYFAALLRDGRMQISTLLDGSSWPGLQVIQVSVFADQPIAMLANDHREIWLWSDTKAVGYYNSGSSSIFDPIGASAYLECGAVSSSIVKADNTFFWLDASDRGAGVARRAQGIIPTRVSNHAVEYQWSLYPKLTDAIGYAYEDQGHVFVCWYFPSANGGLGATWVYDIATQSWHERAYWDAVNGAWLAHRSRSHTYNKSWGKHLIGDWRSGTVYEMKIPQPDYSFCDDDGNPLRRMRISPPITRENEWIYHQRLQVDLEAGLALQVGQGKKPQVMMSYSDDGCHTWSQERLGSAGLIGSYQGRAYWNQLGRSRQRAYRIVVSDPIPWRIIEGDLTASGFTASERVAKQYQKVT